MDKEVILQQPPVIGGYGYARLDTVEAAKFTELPMVHFEGDLYRHPMARGQERNSFEQRFDIYALGCVLLELAMWRPLEDILDLLPNGPSTPEQKEQFSLLEYLGEHKTIPRLHHVAGELFAAAIYLCFVDGDESMSGSNTLARHNAVTQALTKCQL
jgi:hypothetical protein